jgi:hypothetical protein
MPANGDCRSRVGNELQSLAGESLESLFETCPAGGIAQPLVGHEIIELVQIADVNLELHADAIVEHVYFSNIGCRFCARQVDPVGARGRHGESCYQQQEDAELPGNRIHAHESPHQFARPRSIPNSYTPGC